MNRKTLVLPTIACVLAPVIAACGGPEGGGGRDTIVVGTTDRFVATKDDPAPFDPATGYDAGVWNVLRQTVQSLLQVPRGGGSPVPEAAESCDFTDTQNESYRCRLRPGLTFADGTPITPDDVKYSIERVIRINAPNGPVALLAGIDTVETQGEREIIFHLRAPDATFPYKLATPVAGIVPRAAYAPKSPRTGFQVDGSGPYTMKPQVENDRVVRVLFTKNPRYKGDLRVRNDRVELDLFPGAEAMGKAFDDKKIDMMTRTMSPEQSRRLLDNPDDDVRLTEMPGLAIRYLGFDTDDPVVRNKAVRQAMAQIVDRGEIADKVYGTTAEPLYSLIPSGITTHTNSFYNKYGEPGTAKAAAILRAAGVHTPVKLTLHYTTDHFGSGTAAEFRTLRQQLNDTGLFDVAVKGTPWSAFRPAQVRGDYAVYGFAWFPDFPDPDNYTAPFLGRNNFLNSPYQSALAQNTLIPQSRRETDRSAAAKTFRRIQDIVAEDVPILPIWQGKQYAASRTGLSGVEWAVNPSAEIRLWELGRDAD
ncbi:ABC transporter substrate-binding protein [Streptomyces sp. NPDC052042]|uniref:ABC transporter substrate-binding protein n=1 Tax=Streptomyces sp. NPDC052042 TaxID=3365683 RepID=UPI0037CD0FE2